MKPEKLSQNIKSESELKRLEEQGVNVDSLRKTLKEKLGNKIVTK